MPFAGTGSLRRRPQSNQTVNAAQGNSVRSQMGARKVMWGTLVEARAAQKRKEHGRDARATRARGRAYFDGRSSGWVKVLA